MKAIRMGLIGPGIKGASLGKLSTTSKMAPARRKRHGPAVISPTLPKDSHGRELAVFRIASR